MNKKEIHEAIKDYQWMMKLLISKRQGMIGSSNGLTTKYGVEASMPKPQNDPSDPVYQEMIRIEKYEKNTRQIRRKLIFIQRHSRVITNTKNRIILDYLLDGMTLREIAIELGMSLSNVKSRKDDIVHQIYISALSEQKEQKEQKENVR